MWYKPYAVMLFVKKRVGPTIRHGGNSNQPSTSNGHVTKLTSNHAASAAAGVPSRHLTKAKPQKSSFHSFLKLTICSEC